MSLSEFYDTRHENNRIFVSATKAIYRSNTQNPQLPLFNIVFELFDRVVPHDHDQDQSDGYTYDSPQEHEVLHEFCSAPQFFASAERSGPSIADMISRARIPFDLDGHGDQLRWEDERRGEDSASVALHGGAADVAARVSRLAESVVREIDSDPTVSSVHIRVLISKTTVLEADWFWSIFERINYHNDNDNDDDYYYYYYFDDIVFMDLIESLYMDNNGGGDQENIYNSEEIIRLLETVTYGGDHGMNDLICTICMDEVSSGIQVAKLPCSHMFHTECVGTWLRRKTTCPLCRLDLVKPSD